jgi:DNA-binding NarL/FixJ family response regulator
MKRVYLADAQTEERSALRLMLLHLDLQVVGEAADWPTALAQAPVTRPDMVVVDWDLVAQAQKGLRGRPWPNYGWPAQARSLSS